jgi:alkanesulfonate monooxygenase SsuD/methylene tetrahydromethanopterin reductase-like flavin-dependent oxidoreductase (luciferase family)
MEISVAVAAQPSVPPEEELRTAVLADRLGYSELWVGEGWVWDSFALATASGWPRSRSR